MDTRKNSNLGEYQNEQIIQTEDGQEKVIAVDEQGSYVTEVLEQ